MERRNVGTKPRPVPRLSPAPWRDRLRPRKRTRASLQRMVSLPASGAVKVRRSLLRDSANDSLVAIPIRRRLSPAHRNHQRIRADQVVRNHSGSDAATKPAQNESLRFDRELLRIERQPRRRRRPLHADPAVFWFCSLGFRISWKRLLVPTEIRFICCALQRRAIRPVIRKSLIFRACWF